LVQSEVSEMFEQTDGSTLQLAMSDRKKGQEEDEQTFDNEDGTTLTMVMRAMDAAEDRDEGIPNFETLIQHDCNTIRPFDRKNLDNMEDWIAQGRTFKTKNTFVKYNHAYGIPILGREYFTDDSMRRACYLVRFLFAGNEQFRRYAYKTKMYIKGENGGFCCPPNVGNPGLSCPCGKESAGPNKEKNNKFPGPQIFTPAHEMAHWYIKQVLPLMDKAGALQLPRFVNSTEWSWKKPHDEPFADGEICKGAEKRSNTLGLSYDYLWNALQQDHLKGTTKIPRCNTHHYFIYTGQDKFLGLSTGGGEAKEQARKKQKKTNPNLYNLLEIIWPCNNHYISVCEDSAHGMTKGLAQQLIIGKSMPEQPSKMICLSGVDTAEVGMTPVSSLPADDVYKEENKAWNQENCLKKTRKGGWLEAEDTFEELETGEVAKSLEDSNEYAWWLRKCCAKSAKFF